MWKFVFITVALFSGVASLGAVAPANAAASKRAKVVASKPRPAVGFSTTFPSNARTVAAKLTNPRGKVHEVARATIFSGDVTNHGTFKTTDTHVQFTGRYVENGLYFSDPSTNVFNTLTVTSSGKLVGGPGDRWIVREDFFNGSLQGTVWNTGQAELVFERGPAHTFALAGADLGPSYFALQNNFAWGKVTLAPGQSLTFGDGNATAGAALYASVFILEGGVAQIANLTGNGASIYYDPTLSANSYLGGQTYPLAGGGALRPLVAVLRITASGILANNHFQLQLLGVPNRNHTIEATGDLLSPFLPIGTATANGSGVLPFEDLNTTSFTRRFYRVKFP